MGRGFGWFWASYAVSAVGTRLGFDAFALVAILVLHAGPAEVSLLAAVGPAVGAAAAVLLGPWVEFRRKRPVMITMDLVRSAALASVPVAFALGVLGIGQLLAVSMVLAAADIAFRAASGACLRALVAPEHLLAANGRLESTTWTTTALGPPLGGAAIGLLGPVTTIVADAVSFVASAAAIGAIRVPEAPPARPVRRGAADLLDGWRTIRADPRLRWLFANTVTVNALILAPSPLVALLLLRDLGFAPWEYGLAFGIPCLGGLLGARLAPRLVTRFGRHRVLRTAGTLRACWPIGLAFVPPGPGGLALVVAVQFSMITCIGVFTPVFATHRLQAVPVDRVARTLAAWSVTGTLTVAALTALGGLLAAATDTRTAIAVAGLLLLATPALLPRF